MDASEHVFTAMGERSMHVDDETEPFEREPDADLAAEAAEAAELERTTRLTLQPGTEIDMNGEAVWGSTREDMVRLAREFGQEAIFERRRSPPSHSL